MKKKGKKKKVAVEKGLSDVAQKLKKSGFEVATLGTKMKAKGKKEDKLKDTEAVVVKGKNQEVMKKANKTQNKVIDAKKSSPEQVKQKVEKKLK